MATIAITIRVINRDTVQKQIVRLNAERLNGCILDIETGNSRVIQAVSVKELGLGLATIGTLTIPPALTTTVDGVVGRSGDEDVGSGDADKGAFPFFVAKGGFAAEDDLSRLVTSWTGHVCMEY